MLFLRCFFASSRGYLSSSQHSAGWLSTKLQVSGKQGIDARRIRRTVFFPFDDDTICVFALSSVRPPASRMRCPSSSKVQATKRLYERILTPHALDWHCFSLLARSSLLPPTCWRLSAGLPVSQRSYVQLHLLLFQLARGMQVYVMSNCSDRPYCFPSFRDHGKMEV